MKLYYMEGTVYMNSYTKTGYLNQDFRMFHLSDHGLRNIDYHYHDFNKLIIFIQGNVTYCIEGKSYELKPYDIVLVNSGELHKPIILDESEYERIIIYISPGFLNQYKTDAYDLNYCFHQAKLEKSNVLRINHTSKSKLYQVCKELEHSFDEDEFASELYHNLLFLEFMIHLNRMALSNRINYITDQYTNEKVHQIIDYIHAHLKEDINIDSIANALYINKHYLMHLFKAETGYTIGNYITNKRLILAKELIHNGMPATEACYECGYRNYSSFFRAFKKHYKDAPKELFRE